MQNRVSLDDIAIAVPCRAKWDDMQGDDKIRTCSLCQLNVYNVSNMTRTEAEDLLNHQSNSSFCLRLFRRSDGTIITSDCPIGQKLVRFAKRKITAVAAVFAGMLSMIPAFAAHHRDHSYQSNKGQTEQSDKSSKKSNETSGQSAQLSSVEKFGFYVNTNLNLAREPYDSHMEDFLARTKEQSATAEFSAGTNYQRARVYEQLTQFDQALAHYEQAKSIIEKNPDIYDPKFVTVVHKKCAEMTRKSKQLKKREDKTKANQVPIREHLPIR